MKAFAKRTIGLLVGCLAASVLFAQPKLLPHQLKPNPWKATLKVVDETGQPVVGAEVWVGYMATNKAIGFTDTNGVFVASHADRSYALAFGTSKPGYYSYREVYQLGFPVEYEIRRWNPTNTLVLKKIVKPIPMYAKRVGSPPPVDGKPIGYDLMVGDWVAPYGKGDAVDIVFTHDSNRRSFHDYDSKLTVSFPNLGDGIQEFSASRKRSEGSQLMSLYEALADGYLPQIVRSNVSHPGQLLVFDYNANRNYFFRVRTVLDENGNIKSALYGKIYGDFMQFTYYLNPTPNDRNVEFDPKHNLLKQKKFDEVKEP